MDFINVGEPICQNLDSALGDVSSHVLTSAFQSIGSE